jgi:hypothetical protein
MMGSNREGWCKYHRIKGNTTGDYMHLKREIERLIQQGHLQGYVRRSLDEVRWQTRVARDVKDKSSETNKNLPE